MYCYIHCCRHKSFWRLYREEAKARLEARRQQHEEQTVAVTRIQRVVRGIQARRVVAEQLEEMMHLQVAEEQTKILMEEAVAEEKAAAREKQLDRARRYEEQQRRLKMNQEEKER